MIVIVFLLVVLISIVIGNIVIISTILCSTVFRIPSAPPPAHSCESIPASPQALLLVGRF